MSWRDDLPDIPSDRIRRDVVRDGGQRRAAAGRRRANLLGVAAAVALLGIVGAVALSARDTRPGGDAGDDSASVSTEAAAAATVAEGTSPPAPNEAEQTAPTGVEETTADTAASDVTEAADPTTEPFVVDVRVVPTSIWEDPAGGPPCGPVSFRVTALAPGAQRAAVVVRTTAGVRVERDMSSDGRTWTAVLDGFPPGTVGPGGRVELLVEVVATDAAGVEHSAMGPAVELRDCTS